MHLQNYQFQILGRAQQMEAILSNPYIIECAVFVCISTALFFVLKRVQFSDPRIEARLEVFQTNDEKYQIRRYKIGFIQQLLHTPQLAQLAAHLVPNNERARTFIQTKLLHAGIYSQRALVLFFARRLGTMILPPIIGFCMGTAGAWDPGRGLLYGAFIGAFGFLIPEIWLNQKMCNGM